MQAAVKKWAVIRAQRFSVEELARIEQQIQADLLEMALLERNGKSNGVAKG